MTPTYHLLECYEDTVVLGTDVVVIGPRRRAREVARALERVLGRRVTVSLWRGHYVLPGVLAG
jgi:hypothetical protein